MEITKIENAECTVLTLAGRLDTTTSPKLQETLNEVIAASLKVELDFANLVYVSSAGLRVLLIGEKNAKAAGKSMVVKNILPDIMEVFEMTGFSDILTII